MWVLQMQLAKKQAVSFMNVVKELHGDNLTVAIGTNQPKWGRKRVYLAMSANPQKIIVDAKSGISGAGRNLDSTKLFPEGKDNFQAYAVETHRHYPEMLGILNDNNSDLDILFVPHLSSMIRGIYSTLYLRYNHKNLEEVIAEYQEFYKNSPFVEVSENSSFPKVSEVENTNTCKIAIHATTNTTRGPNLVILSTIDNLVKGASGQAVQNMNIMFNLDEKSSLI